MKTYTMTINLTNGVSPVYDINTMDEAQDIFVRFAGAAESVEIKDNATGEVTTYRY